MEADNIKIEIHRSSDLPPLVTRELKARVDREFGHVEIVRNHVWSEPDWVFILKSGDEIASFLNLVDRQGFADGKPMHLVGLNNVITEPTHRNKGFSRRLNKVAIDHMRSMDDNAYGLLFCADELVPFYQKLGWSKFNGKVLVEQPSGEQEWKSNCMLFPLGSSHSRPNLKINLNGLPW